MLHRKGGNFGKQEIRRWQGKEVESRVREEMVRNSLCTVRAVIVWHLRKLGPNRFSFPAKALLQQIPEKAFGAAAANRAGSRNIEQ